MMIVLMFEEQNLMRDENEMIYESSFENCLYSDFMARYLSLQT